jgi:hypothetical protein
VEVFFKRLFKKLGIALSPNVAYYLHTKEKSRVKRLAMIKTREAKQKKNKRKYDKLQEHTRTAKKEYLKRTGTYRKGMNLDDPYGEEAGGEEDEETGAAQPPQPAKKKPKRFCEYCGSSSHLTKKSKKCTAPKDAVRKYRRENGSLLSEPNTLAPVEALDEDALAIQDCDRMDAMPFDADYDSDIDIMALALGGAACDSDNEEEDGGLGSI